MKYRPHRGALADSIAEVVDLGADATIVDLARLLDVAPERVKVVRYGFDARIGWDSHLVTVNGLPAGFTDGPLVTSAWPPAKDDHEG